VSLGVVVVAHYNYN